MKKLNSELFEHLSILLTPVELREVSGEIDRLINDVQNSITGIEKLDLKAVQLLAHELENETASYLAGNIYPQVMNDQVKIPWLILTNQKTRQNVKDLTSERVEELNDAYDSLFPHIERYRFVRDEVHKCFDSLICQQLRLYLKNAKERIGYFYIKGKRLPKVWQTELKKIKEGIRLDKAYHQAAKSAEGLEYSLLTKLKESHEPYENAFFTVDTCRKYFEKAFEFCLSI